jgi:hypothetical protein
VGAEDFSFYQEKFQGYTFRRRSKGKPISETAPHHTQIFYIDESGFVLE